MGRLGGYLKDKLGNIFLPYPCLPVGSIYLSVSETNPSTYFGGTWEQWGKGRVPVSVDKGDTDFNEVEKTGGKKTHKLTINEMPSHTHSIGNSGSLTSGYAGMFRCNNNDGYSSSFIQSTGGNQPHNILQPYITCYMWKRVA